MLILSMNNARSLVDELSKLEASLKRSQVGLFQNQV